MKKLLIVLLSTLMVLCLGVVNVAAEGEETTVGAGLEAKPLNIKVKVDEDEAIAVADFDKDDYKVEGYNVSFTVGNKENITSSRDVQQEATKKANADFALVEQGPGREEKLKQGTGDFAALLTCGKTYHKHTTDDCYEVCTNAHTVHNQTNCASTSVDAEYQSSKPNKGKFKVVINGVTSYVDGSDSHLYMNNHYEWKYCTEELHVHETAGEENIGTKKNPIWASKTCLEEEHEHNISCYTVVVPVTTTQTLIEYTVTFDANGGKWSDETTTNKEIKTSIETDYKVVDAEEPTKDGYNFLGWFKDVDIHPVKTNFELVDLDTAEFKDNTTTLVAKWYKDTVVEDKEGNESKDSKYVLTTEDKEHIANGVDGADYRVKLTIENIDPSQDDLDKINAELATTDVVAGKNGYKINGQIQAYYAGEWHKSMLVDTSYIDELEEYVVITMPIKVEEKAGYVAKNFKVWSYHDSQVYNCEVLDVDLTNGTISFKANKFSTFEATYSYGKLPTPSPKPTPKKVVYVAPKTGVE